MAPLSVLFQGAALLVAAAAMVALEGLLHCEQEFQLGTKTHQTSTTYNWHSQYHFFEWFRIKLKMCILQVETRELKVHEQVSMAMCE